MPTSNYFNNLICFSTFLILYFIILLSYILLNYPSLLLTPFTIYLFFCLYYLYSANTCCNTPTFLTALLFFLIFYFYACLAIYSFYLSIILTLIFNYNLHQPFSLIHKTPYTILSPQFFPILPSLQTIPMLLPNYPNLQNLPPSTLIQYPPPYYFPPAKLPLCLESTSLHINTQPH